MPKTFIGGAVYVESSNRSGVLKKWLSANELRHIVGEAVSYIEIYSGIARFSRDSTAFLFNVGTSD